MPYLSYSTSKGIRYWGIYESYRINGKIKHRLLLYLGTISKILNEFGKTGLNLEDLKITNIVNHGEILAIHKTLSEFNLLPKINELVPKTRGNGIDVGRLTEIMIINALITQKSKDQISDWYAETILPKIMGIPPDRLYAQLFCRALDYFTNEVILELEKYLTIALQNRFSFEINRVFYDITSVYLEGDKCPLAEFGYNRTGKRHKKQVLLGLVIVPSTQFPILYKVYKGNTAEVKTAQEVMEQLFELYGIRDVIAIMDRGMISDKVRLEFDEMHLRYISALDEGSKEARDLILTVSRSELRGLTLRNGRKVYFKRLEGSIKSIRAAFGIKHQVRKNYAELDDLPFLYLVGKSPEISKAKKNEHYEAIAEALTELKTFQHELNEKAAASTKKGRPIDVCARLKQILHGVSKYIQCRWRTIGDHIQLEVTLKKKNLRIARKIKGRFVLCASDLSLNSQEVVQGYIDKYQIEHVFRFLKSDMDIRPFWHRKANRVIAYFFLSYIAYLLKSTMEYQFKKSRLNLSFKEALTELSRLKLIMISAGQQSLEKLSEYSPLQKKICKSLKVNLSD